jgi:hypothetical protein
MGVTSVVELSDFDGDGESDASVTRPAQPLALEGNGVQMRVGSLAQEPAQGGEECR